MSICKDMENQGNDHMWTLIARKLSGEATPEELDQLDALLHDDPMAGYSREVLQDLWLAQPVPDSFYAEQKYKELIQELKSRGIDEGKFGQDDHYINSNEIPDVRFSGKRKKLVLAGCLLATLLVLVGMIYSYSNADRPTAVTEAIVKNQINTKNGSKTSLVLPDGTKVWLNSNSQLTYEKSYGNKLREVSLTGEAYFDVVKNPEKPFIIHTNKMDVKVLGTAFNVKCYPGEKTTETSLVRGSIEVTLRDRKEKIMLKPNEKLVINNAELPGVAPARPTAGAPKPIATVEKPIISLSHLTFYPADNTVIETAWVQNKLVFSAESFEEVALKMERWYGVDIQFADETIKQQPLTGNFEKETVEEALEALQFATRFNYSIKNNKIIINRSSGTKK